MKKSIYLTAVILTVFTLTGCAHTGLVAGPGAPEVSVEREGFIEERNPETPPFTGVPQVDIDALWKKGVLPEYAIARIRLIQSRAHDTREQIAEAVISRPILDTTLPAPVLQEPDETLRKRLKEAETAVYGTPVPQEE